VTPFLARWLVIFVLLGWCPAASGETLRNLETPSLSLGRPLTYSLYRPDGARGALPAIYLLHGRNSKAADWLDMANAVATAERLIAGHKLPLCLIVMPDAGNDWYAGKMAAAIVSDLPAAIEARHGAIASREARAIAGISMGGFGAVGLALTNPERFSVAAAMSGAFWIPLGQAAELDAGMTSRVERVFEGAFGKPFSRAEFLKHSPHALAVGFPANRHKPAIYLVSGREDRFGLGAQTEAMWSTLKAKGFDTDFDIVPGDHDWGTWQRSLPMVLEFIARRWAR